MEPLPPDDVAPSRPGRQVPRGVWWAVAVAIVVLAVAGLKATSSTPTGDPPSVLGSDDTTFVNPLTEVPTGFVGRPMPDLEMERFSGGTTTIAAYRGTPMVINLWASTCTPCIAEMPDLETLHQQYGDRVTFVGIDTFESIDQGRPRQASTGVTYDLLSDPQATIAGQIEAANLPATVLVKADGTIARIKYNGAVKPDQLRQWIDQDLLS